MDHTYLLGSNPFLQAILYLDIKYICSLPIYDVPSLRLHATLSEGLVSNEAAIHTSPVLVDPPKGIPRECLRNPYGSRGIPRIQKGIDGLLGTHRDSQKAMINSQKGNYRGHMGEMKNPWTSDGSLFWITWNLYISYIFLYFPFKKALTKG